MPNNRLVPLIVAVALFMENMDSTVIATSLPAIALDLGTNPLALKLAVTSYLLSLAVFIPASGWCADRFGARTVFRIAIAVFVAGSIACAFAHALGDFVVARIVQGMGGAMMSPVGRLVMIRSVDKRELVNAMAWVSLPALVGPVMGPPLGGFITTYLSWHWIFLINVPIGVVGILFATYFIPDLVAENPGRFDFKGLALGGLGVAGLAFGFSVLGLDYLPRPLVAAMIAAGALLTYAYVRHARTIAAPVLDLRLFEIATFRASVVGGFLFRTGIGALPFLLPLLLQVGFGYTPLQSGLTTFATALGAMGMKIAVPRILKRWGFRSVLMVNAVVSAVFLAVCGAFTAATPVELMFLLLLVGGFFRSLEFSSINTIAYADVDQRRMSRATSLTAVGQQLSLSAGVAVGALVVETTLRLKGSAALGAADFWPAFLVVGAIAASAVLVFAKLPADAGEELAQRGPVVPSMPATAASTPSDRPAA